MANQKYKTSERLKEIAERLFDGVQAEMAREMGMSAQGMNPYFNNERMPGFKIITRIVQLGVNLNWLIAGIGPMLLKDNEPMMRGEFEQELLKFKKDTLTTYLAIMVPENSHTRCLKNMTSIEEIVFTPINKETGSAEFNPTAPAPETDELTQKDKPTNHE